MSPDHDHRPPGGTLLLARDHAPPDDDVPDGPAEALPLGCKIPHIHDFLRHAVLLQSVFVHDRDEIRQAEMGGGHGRFPDGALIEFAIPKKDKNASHVVCLTLERERAAHAEGESLAQAPAGKLYALLQVHGWVRG